LRKRWRVFLYSLASSIRSWAQSHQRLYGISRWMLRSLIDIFGFNNLCSKITWIVQSLDTSSWQDSRKYRKGFAKVRPFFAGVSLRLVQGEPSQGLNWKGHVRIDAEERNVVYFFLTVIFPRNRSRTRLNPFARLPIFCATLMLKKISVLTEGYPTFRETVPTFILFTFILFKVCYIFKIYKSGKGIYRKTIASKASITGLHNEIRGAWNFDYQTARIPFRKPECPVDRQQLSAKCLLKQN